MPKIENPRSQTDFSFSEAKRVDESQSNKKRKKFKGAENIKIQEKKERKFDLGRRWGDRET